jgi:hypothetical protein
MLKYQRFAIVRSQKMNIALCLVVVLHVYCITYTEVIFWTCTESYKRVNYENPQGKTCPIPYNVPTVHTIIY